MLERSVVTFGVLISALAVHALSLTVKSDDVKDVLEDSRHNKKESVKHDVTQQYENNGRRYAAMSLVGAPLDHPFLFPNEEQSYLHGKKREYNRPIINSLYFHGKRNENLMSEWLEPYRKDERPSSKMFHGKKDAK